MKYNGSLEAPHLRSSLVRDGFAGVRRIALRVGERDVPRSGGDHRGGPADAVSFARVREADTDADATQTGARVREVLQHRELVLRCVEERLADDHPSTLRDLMPPRGIRAARCNFDRKRACDRAEHLCHHDIAPQLERVAARRHSCSH